MSSCSTSTRSPSTEVNCSPANVQSPKRLELTECLVQEIFDEIADFGARCAQIGVVAQTHAIAHFAAPCALVNQCLEALVQSDRRLLAAGQVIQLPVVRRRIDGDRDRLRNIHVTPSSREILS